MRNISFHFFTLLLSMTCMVTCAEVREHKKLTAPLIIQIRPDVGGEIGVPRRNCRGLGLGCIVIRGVYVFESPIKAGELDILLEPLSQGSLRMHFPYPKDVEPGSEQFLVEKEVKLDPGLAAAFGFSSATILIGEYKVVYKETGLSYVDLRMLTR